MTANFIFGIGKFVIRPSVLQGNELLVNMLQKHSIRDVLHKSCSENFCRIPKQPVRKSVVCSLVEELIRIK